MIDRFLFLAERVTGVARASDARRRSRPRWAPPHGIFLLKNSAPAFDSRDDQANKKNARKEHSFCLLSG